MLSNVALTVLRRNLDWIPRGRAASIEEFVGPTVSLGINTSSTMTGQILAEEGQLSRLRKYLDAPRGCPLDDAI
jgi:hypothetical protein